MSPDNQRIAIAEACGIPKPFTSWTQGGKVVLAHSVSVKDGMKHGQRVPDYLHDLNAMHEAEKHLLKMQGRWANLVEYRRHLMAVNGCEDVIHFTAAQRAEAFLRTIGKWEDSK